MILPRPVKRDGNGRLTKDYSRREWFAKILEEVLEAHDTLSNTRLAEELTDIITVCTSYLDAIGYNENDRAELQRQVNEKNFKRNYFEE